MSLNGFLNLTGLYTDVPLGNGSTAVLEELLHQSDVIMAVLIDLGGIVLPEAVGADILVTQVVTDRFEMPLNGSFTDWEDPLILQDALIQAVAADKLIKGQRNREYPGLPGFLLCDC